MLYPLSEGYENEKPQVISLITIYCSLSSLYIIQIFNISRTTFDPSVPKRGLLLLKSYSILPF